MICETPLQAKRYAAFGMDIMSDVALPLLPLSTEGVDAGLVAVRVSQEIPKPSVQPDCLARVGYDWGDLLLMDRHNLVVDIHDQAFWANEAGRAMISASVSSTGLAALMYANGIWPIHASAVLSPEGQAVLLLGRQGAGKSTMATGLVQQGWQLISDDCSALTYLDGCWRVFPGTQKHKLTAPARRQLGMDGLSVSDVPMQPDKKFIEQDWHVHRNDGYPVGTAVLLLNDNHPSSRALPLPTATKMVARFAFRRKILGGLFDQTERLQNSLSFCQSVSVRTLYRNDDLSTINEDLARLREICVV